MAKFKRMPLEKLHQLEHALEPKAKEVKQSICSFSFFVAAVKTFCLVVFFYTFSIGLTFYNQRFIRVRMDSRTEWYNLMLLHFASAFCMSYMYLCQHLMILNTMSRKFSAASPFTLLKKYTLILKIWYMQKTQL